MCCKELLIKRLPELDRMPLKHVSQYLDTNLEHEVIDQVNWSERFPYKPFCSFVVAVSSTRLYVFFSVISKDLRAVHTSDLSSVAEDSCVEFFLQVPGNEEYWNFELNCIGALNSSHRVDRAHPTRLTTDELKSIGRYSSCGSEPIDEQEGTFCWDIVVSIPLQLVGLDGASLPEYVTGNFYKCGSKTAHPHYVSWSAIDGEKPDFHRPDCFGKLWFKQKVTDIKMQEATSTEKSHKNKGAFIRRLLRRFFSKSFL